MGFGVILLSAYIITSSNAPKVSAQTTCIEGPPLDNQTAPFVNFTVQPSLNITELSPITVECDAANGSTSLPPVKITIRVGIYTGRACEDGGNPVYRCVYNLRSYFPGLPRRISCTAENADGDCHRRSATVTLRPRVPPPTAAPTTPITNSTTTSSTVATTDSTTAAPTTETKTTTTTPPPPTTPTDPTAPFVNFTVQPSLNITELSPITVICDAANGSTSLPPVKITIRVGIYTGRACEDGGNPVYRCVYNLENYFPGIPREISCTAENANGDSNRRSAIITLRPRVPPPPPTTAPTSPITNATTSPATTAATTAATTSPATTAATTSPATPATTAATTQRVTTSSTAATDSATAAPTTETTTPPPPTKRPVTSTTKQVIPPITTTSPTTEKKDDDDDDESTNDGSSSTESEHDD